MSVYAHPWRSRPQPTLPAALAAGAAVMIGAPSAMGAWTAAVPVSKPHDAIYRLQPASGPAGEMLSWEFADLVPPAREVFGAPGARYATSRSGGPFAAEQRLTPGGRGVQVVDLGGGRLAQLSFVPAGASTTPRVALGSVSGRFGPRIRVPGAVVMGRRASLAGNARGDMLLTWISGDSHGYHRVVWASVRAPGGAFGKPRVISRASEAEQVRAAVGVQGDMLVAFPSKRGRLLARVRRHGRSWGPLQNVGPAAGGTENDLTPYVAVHGRILLAWYETQLCSAGCAYPG
jgi:hypothetical protein